MSLDRTYGVPKEEISCPGCGKRYKGKICKKCEECQGCCRCELPEFVSAKQMIEEVLQIKPSPL